MLKFPEGCHEVCSNFRQLIAGGVRCWTEMVMEVVLEVTVECENYSRYDNIFNIVVILNKISFFSDRPVPLGNGHGGGVGGHCRVRELQQV